MSRMSGGSKVPAIEVSSVGWTMAYSGCVFQSLFAVLIISCEKSICVSAEDTSSTHGCLAIAREGRRRSAPC